MSRQLFSALLIMATLIMAAATVQAERLDDPMRPPMQAKDRPVTTTKKGVIGFNLSSTLIAQGRRNAVINGRRVSVGDTINGAKVEEIMPTRVKLHYAGKSRTIHMLPITVKKPSKGNRP